MLGPQVHVATLWSGEQVVVKVQRPGLKKLFDIDLNNLRLLAEQLDKQDEANRWGAGPGGTPCTRGYYRVSADLRNGVPEFGACHPCPTTMLRRGGGSTIIKARACMQLCMHAAVQPACAASTAEHLEPAPMQPAP